MKKITIDTIDGIILGIKTAMDTAGILPPRHLTIMFETVERENHISLTIRAPWALENGWRDMQISKTATNEELSELCSEITVHLINLKEEYLNT